MDARLGFEFKARWYFRNVTSQQLYTHIMAVKFSLKSGGVSCKDQQICPDVFGCPANTCPDFVIRRHDTKPPLKVSVEDCDGAMDLQALVIEVNMWALGKFKAAITDSDTYFQLADNIGFEQIMVGDIIVMDRVRLPERMLVTGFDEANKLVQVQRGYHGTTPSAWKKAETMRIFRIMNAPAESELSYEDITEVDGTVTKDVLQGAYLIYEWQPEDTCLPGCYWLEFKILKMIDTVFYLPGGNWTGTVHTHTDGFFYTGTSQTESSVRLSLDQVAAKYFIPDIPWTGDTHLHSDDNYYTGLVHNDGSVILNKTGIPSDAETEYNEEGLALIDISTISFTDDATPYYLGCILGEGVEWVRRMPISGEGFLIKIEDSPTVELVV